MDNSIDKMVKLLHDKYGKMVLTKAETAKELGFGISTLTKRMSQGLNVPNYIKMDGATNATVLFPILEVAKYLARTIKVN